MADESHEVFVSAASAWEIATKQRIGELPPRPMPTGGFNEMVMADGFVSLSVGAANAWHAGSLAWAYRDSFDGMSAAQATMDRLVLVTHDSVFADLQISTLW